jgi:hypothetical protein
LRIAKYVILIYFYLIYIYFYLIYFYLIYFYLIYLFLFYLFLFNYCDWFSYDFISVVELYDFPSCLMSMFYGGRFILCESFLVNDIVTVECD